MSGIRPLFEAMLLFVIGLALLPIITSSANTAADDPNATSAVATLVGLLPLLYVLILVVGAIAYVYFRTTRN